MPEPTPRQRAFALMERPDRSHRGAQVIEIALIALIAANIVAVTLETVEPIYQRYAALFDAFELISVAVFTLEYALRLWVVVETAPGEPGWRLRWHYARSPMAVIDLLAILPFYLSMIFAIDLRFLRALRLLRVFKLTRYSPAMSMLLDVFKEESSAFFAGFFILFVLLILAASGAYLVEHDVQPDKFGSVPQAMWWAMATLTTVGYGDVTPVTAAGKIFGSMVTIVGIGMAALPAGILASGLADHLHRRRDSLRNQFRLALEDGVITGDEGRELEALRKELGISREVARAIYEEVDSRQRKVASCTCPQCGHRFERPSDETTRAA